MTGETKWRAFCISPQQWSWSKYDRTEKCGKFENYRLAWAKPWVEKKALFKAGFFNLWAQNFDRPRSCIIGIEYVLQDDPRKQGH